MPLQPDVLLLLIALGICILTLIAIWPTRCE
jgi:hypothetical protein